MPAISGNTDTGTLNYNSWYVFQFVKKYGDIFSLNLGDVSSVIITGLPLIKEVFTHMEENILKRPITCTRERISNNNGKFIEQHGMCIIVFLICYTYLYLTFQHAHKQFHHNLPYLKKAEHHVF